MSVGSHASVGSETARVRRIWDRQARGYDRRISLFERVLFEGGREWVCSQAGGQALELAVGTGRNLAHYRAEVELTGIELSPAMLEIARRRAEDLGISPDLRVGDAEALPFPNESFDCVVITLALCSIPDDRRAAREACRVLRSDGRLLMLEHVRSPARGVRLVQRLLNPLSVRFEGDHLTRDPLDYLGTEGFEIERVERSKWGIVQRIVARKADRDQPHGAEVEPQ